MNSILPPSQPSPKGEGAQVKSSPRGGNGKGGYLIIKIKPLIGKTLYGLLFVAVIPLLLVLWAKATSGLINLPVPENPVSGYLLSSVGLVLILSGIIHLWVYGKGLPMNAYPPEKFVTSGIYALTKHPIYAGAVLMSFGISLIFRSASGLWLISPLLH